MSDILTCPRPIPALSTIILIQLCLKRCILAMAEDTSARRDGFVAGLTTETGALGGSPPSIILALEGRRAEDDIPR